MKHLKLYRALVRLLPHKWDRFSLLENRSLSEKSISHFEAVLKRHRASGGALAFFDAKGMTDHLVYGELRSGLKVAKETAFRLASLSKTVTASGVMALSQAGLLDLNRDANLGLPYSLRHPRAKDRPVALIHLLSHASGIRDGKAYDAALLSNAPASRILSDDSHTAHLPGEGCAYSNFAFGLIAPVVEAQTGLSFQKAMDKALFSPLQMRAAFYPGLIKSPLADGRRILPPSRTPNFDGLKRQSSLPEDWDQVDLERHYALAQGACCSDVDGLVRLGQALLTPGFFNQDSLEMMRSPHASLRDRDPYLTQGLGLFILNDDSIAPYPLYGHQGMAYGAVQMMYLDLEKQRGIISLTTGASEARQYILTDLNRALLKEWMKND